MNLRTKTSSLLLALAIFLTACDSDSKTIPTTSAAPINYELPSLESQVEHSDFHGLVNNGSTIDSSMIQLPSNPSENWQAFVVFSQEEEVSEDWNHGYSKIKKAFRNTDVLLEYTADSSLFLVFDTDTVRTVDMLPFYKKHESGYLLFQNDLPPHFLGDHGLFYTNDSLDNPIHQANVYFGLK